jgi:hypothetical protein
METSTTAATDTKIPFVSTTEPTPCQHLSRTDIGKSDSGRQVCDDCKQIFQGGIKVTVVPEGKSGTPTSTPTAAPPQSKASLKAAAKKEKKAAHKADHKAKASAKAELTLQKDTARSNAQLDNRAFRAHEELVKAVRSLNDLSRQVTALYTKAADIVKKNEPLITEVRGWFSRHKNDDLKFLGKYQDVAAWSQAVFSLTPQRLGQILNKDQQLLTAGAPSNPLPPDADELKRIAEADKAKQDREVANEKLEAVFFNAEVAVAKAISYKGDITTSTFQEAKLKAFTTNPPQPKTDTTDYRTVDMDTAVNDCVEYIRGAAARRSEAQRATFIDRVVSAVRNRSAANAA